MREDAAEILVGGVVLAAAIGFAVFAAQAAGITRSSATYPLHASFRSLEGVGLGSDLRLAGVRIGEVSAIALNPETYRVETTLSVQRGIEIPDDSAVVVSSEGLLGGNFVEIRPGGSPEAFEPGADITDTQGAVSLISLLMKFVTGRGEE
ncbi:outer membrane lipid asymmetry maintenance protein MlaD [Sulfitobacter aestuarii]|uniref:Outer membrane lipid asymmetry maintenance protein MlaD n=1 Tax=Sulfitobacter aestuarii TaxID=2161676 RepID=A0ABW5U205_9RHOB